MSNSSQLNQVYNQVRNLGVPYEIKESSGSVIIKISSSHCKQQIFRPKEKFRFHSTRTLNGSSNLDWRAPRNYEESVGSSKSSLPDIPFFRTTPPPYCHTSSPPPSTVLPPRASFSPVTPEAGQTHTSQTDSDISSITTAPTATSLESTNFVYNEKAQDPKTFVLNPFRCSKRLVVFPRTPTLLNPSPNYNPLNRTSVIVDMSPMEEEKSESGYEALISVMEAFYEQRRILNKQDLVIVNG